MADEGVRARVVEVDGHEVRVTHPEKILYPLTGTTKGQVVDHCLRVAPHLVPLAAGRPATRKRWVDGVGTPEAPGESFFQRRLDDSAPAWVHRGVQHHRDHDAAYPLVDDAATLVWLAQMAALEIHVPQWRFDSSGAPGAPDRMVFDLDPGRGVGLHECATVALLVRTVLEDHDLESVPVTSGSKGIHVYARLDGTSTSQEAEDLAHTIARTLAAGHPDLVVSTMDKEERTGRVFIDWSQNHAHKTTVVPYSLRGRFHPTVAMPRTWEELEGPDLHQVGIDEVAGLLEGRGDPAKILV